MIWGLRFAALAGEAAWRSIDGVREQLKREPRQLPMLVIKRKPASILDYQFEDFEILDYNPHPPIKFPVAV